MSFSSLLRFLVGFTVVAVGCRAGSLVGTVVARGATDSGGGGGDKYASRKFKFLDRTEYDSLRDFVVSIEGPVGAPSRPPTRKAITQVDGTFLPHVLPVMVGDTVDMLNEDKIFHNVFSLSDAREFDLGLYQKPEKKSVVFDKVGRVDVMCSIHTQMSCVVLVLENSFFALTDEAGRYVIKGLPAGKYVVRAWHERLPSVRREIVVAAEAETQADFVLGPGGKKVE